MEPRPHLQPASPGGWHLRKSTPEDFGGLGEDSDADLSLRPETGRRLLCRVCKQPVTADEHRIAPEGRHVHRRVNPMGIEYEFGCFAAAPGAATLGPPVSEHSWFAGYAWSFAHCRRCGVHLGWHFEGGEPAFYGLVLNHLEEEPESPDHGL